MHVTIKIVLKGNRPLKNPYVALLTYKSKCFLVDFFCKKTWLFKSDICKRMSFSASKWHQGQILKFSKPYCSTIGYPQNIFQDMLPTVENVRGIRGSWFFCEKRHCLLSLLSYMYPQDNQKIVQTFLQKTCHPNSNSKSSVCLFIRCKITLRK